MGLPSAPGALAKPRDPVVERSDTTGYDDARIDRPRRGRSGCDPSRVGIMARPSAPGAPAKPRHPGLTAGIPPGCKIQRLESVYQRKLAALDELKKSLLHRAFSGEL